MCGSWRWARRNGAKKINWLDKRKLLWGADEMRERERESCTAKKWRSRQIEIMKREWTARDLEWLVRRAGREEEYLFCLLIEIQDAWSQPCCDPTGSPFALSPCPPSFFLTPLHFLDLSQCFPFLCLPASQLLILCCLTSLHCTQILQDMAQVAFAY